MLLLLHLPQDDEWTAALLSKAKAEAEQSMRMRWVVKYRQVSDEYPADGDQHVPDLCRMDILNPIGTMMTGEQLFCIVAPVADESGFVWFTAMLMPQAITVGA